jgi:lipoprotein NlpI
MRVAGIFLLAAIGASASRSEEIPSDLKAKLQAADAAIAANPRDAKAYRARAAIFSATEDHQQAISDYDRVLELEPDSAEAFDQRGSQHFMLGHISQSIADFDRSIQLRPEQEPWHWKRGISYYYAGRYDQGRRQFEGYQTVDDHDVENAVWRYLCMARGQGVAIARDRLLPINRDARVPMMEVYSLYRGQATSEDVLRAARAGNPSPTALNERLFYAHLYLGLYYEAAGDVARAREHLATAAERHKIGHYMWNVADVHVKRLKAQGEKPKQPLRPDERI